MRLDEIPLFTSDAATFKTFRRAESTRPAPAVDEGRTHGADAPGRQVDWGQVVSLRRLASEEIAHRLDQHARAGGRPYSADDRRLLGREVVREIVRRHAEAQSEKGSALWSLDTELLYAEAVENAIFGYGRLQPLFEIPTAENIEIHGFDSVTIQYGDGRRESHPPIADSDEELVEAIRFLGESASPSRPFDDAHPTMTLAIGDRFRLHAIGFGLAYRPSVTIRQHILTEVTLPDLVDGGLMPEEVGRFLHAAVLARKSIVIAGDQGAGKTTLLRALISAIPHNERFGTIETDYELLTHLQPGRRNIVALQARVGMGERSGDRSVGDVTVADLIPEALRQNLSRLVVGEVRGGEAGAMFEAMQAGAGSLSTTHSHSAASTMDRLASRVAQGGVLDVEEAYRQIAQNIALLVYVKLTDDTWRGGTRRRVIGEIRQLTGGFEGDRPTTHVVYDHDRRSGDPFSPDPVFMNDLAEFDDAWQAAS